MAELTVRIEGDVATPGGGGTATQVITGAIPEPPPKASYLGGSAVSTGTIITIPAGRIWYGWLSLSADYTSATADATSPNIHTTGAGASPDPASKIVEMRLRVVADGATGDNVKTPYMYIYAGPGDTQVTLETGAAQDVTAVAYGWLI